ncbi:MAG TPA: rhomboid family intramembrane serine protease [Fimbriimonadaceae bacterium]|mgnify:CR=1 FL=1|nr:rhomboid family intramembrane serine protease [Fimbriimonadaceae bacterium]
MSIFRDFGDSARRQGAPVTVGLVVAMIVGFLFAWMDTTGRIFLSMILSTDVAWREPWRFLTYPYIAGAGSFIGLIFLCWWLWGIGGSVERELGAKRYLTVWIVFSVLCGLGLAIGATLLGQSGQLMSGWTPVAAITVMWGTRNASAEVRLMMVIPVSGRWMAWIAAGLVFFGTQPPMLAPFAAAPLLLAWLYAANKIAVLPYSYGGGFGGGPRGMNAAGTRKVYRKEYYEEVKRREQARAEKDKLRELFERSMIDDPDEKK